MVRVILVCPKKGKNAKIIIEVWANNKNYHDFLKSLESSCY